MTHRNQLKVYCALRGVVDNPEISAYLALCHPQVLANLQEVIPYCSSFKLTGTQIKVLRSLVNGKFRSGENSGNLLNLEAKGLVTRHLTIGETGFPHTSWTLSEAGTAMLEALDAAVVSSVSFVR